MGRVLSQLKDNHKLQHKWRVISIDKKTMLYIATTKNDFGPMKT